MKHKFMDGFVTPQAFKKGHIRVVESGKTRTLVLTGSVYLNSNGGDVSDKNFEEFKKDVDAYWGHLSFQGSDGFTYKTQLSLSRFTGDDWRNADISFGYARTGEKGGGESMRQTGEIWLDSTNRTNLQPGVAAHEFAHAFLGLDDAYRPVQMPSGYYIPKLVAFGWENDIMGKTGGTVSASDLQALILALMGMSSSGKPGEQK
jgi:hypothetical protein